MGGILVRRLVDMCRVPGEDVSRFAGRGQFTVQRVQPLAVGLEILVPASEIIDAGPADADVAPEALPAARRRALGDGADVAVVGEVGGEVVDREGSKPP